MMCKALLAALLLAVAQLAAARPIITEEQQPQRLVRADDGYSHVAAGQQRLRANKAALKADYANDRPLIGILTQPCKYCPGLSYIAAANVKWVELAGGRPVPIRYNANDTELYRLFKSVNGLLFPGGLTWLWLDSPYVITARKLYNWAVESNDAGVPFPIHGICLGHQLLHILTSNVSRNDLLIDTDSVQQPSTLQLTPHARSSTFFRFMPDDLFAKLQDPSKLLALQNHMYGIPPPFYHRFPVLDDFFTILSTSVDRKGQEYVSTVEAKRYPFTGTQWHPEKPPFEFALEAVPHSLDAIRVSQALANAFIDTARTCPHRPASKEEELALELYDVPPVFSARFETFDDDNYDGPDMTYYLDVDLKNKTTNATTAAASQAKPLVARLAGAVQGLLGRLPSWSL